MTYSDAWIDTVDDVQFKAFVKSQGANHVSRSERIDLLPNPVPATYWLPLVQDWAKVRGIEIEYIDNCWIKVPVSRVRLLEFLDDVLGASSDSKVERLRVHVRNHLRDDRTYLIVAEEF